MFLSSGFGESETQLLPGFAWPCSQTSNITSCLFAPFELALKYMAFLSLEGSYICYWGVLYVLFLFYFTEFWKSI